MSDLTSITRCANHPAVETSLRCNQCEKPICAKCAVRTPTGYRCRECVRGIQKKFVTAEWVDYLTGFFTALVLSFLASLLVGVISSIAGFFAWIIIMAAVPSLGMIIAEAVRFVTRKHRSRPLFLTVGAAVVAGAIPVLVFNLVSFNIFGLLFIGIYIFVATPVVYSRLAGIRLTR